MMTPPKTAIRVTSWNYSTFNRTRVEKFLKIFRPRVITLLRPFFGKAQTEQFRSFIRPLAETYVSGWREGRDLLFYNAPALMIFHHSPYADSVDAAFACASAMWAAEALGLGTTVIGGGATILQRNRALCSRLGIPGGNTPCLSMILGYPDVAFHHAVQRRFSHRKTVE
jgi:nitroreductase